jgi:hypothetical protein
MHVRQYEAGDGAGPDHGNLHIDMRSGPDSVWNKRVIEILLEKLIQKRDEDQWRLPKVSEHYFVDMLRDKVKRVRSYWAATQPRMMGTGD